MSSLISNNQPGPDWSLLHFVSPRSKLKEALKVLNDPVSLLTHHKQKPCKPRAYSSPQTHSGFCSSIVSLYLYIHNELQWCNANPLSCKYNIMCIFVYLWVFCVLYLELPWNFLDIVMLKYVLKSTCHHFKSCQKNSRISKIPELCVTPTHRTHQKANLFWSESGGFMGIHGLPEAFSVQPYNGPKSHYILHWSLA